MEDSILFDSVKMVPQRRMKLTALLNKLLVNYYNLFKKITLYNFLITKLR